MAEEVEGEEGLEARIEAAGQALEVDQGASLGGYYDYAGDLLEQADTHRKKKNLIELYAGLLRFTRLVRETIPLHREFNKFKYWKQRRTFLELAVRAENELELLKPEVQSHVEFSRSDVQSTPTSMSQTSDKQDDESDGLELSISYNIERDTLLDGNGNPISPFASPTFQNKEQSGNLFLNMEQALAVIPRKEDMEAKGEFNIQLQHIIADTATLRQELYEESNRRRRAQKLAEESNCKADISARQRLKAERELNEVKVDLQKLKTKQEETAEELQKARMQNKSLESLITEFKKQLISSENSISLLQRQRDDAFRAFEEIHMRKGTSPTNFDKDSSVLKFSYSELEEATNYFDQSVMIGEGRCGKVYKGYIHHTAVAIKVPDPQWKQEQLEFNRKVAILTGVRHPHLVNFLGLCPESQSLIFEFLPYGSLEECLYHKDNCFSLSWQVRIHIAREACSGIIFLHSRKPNSILHGNLKLSNILLDANFVSKLCDLNFTQLLNADATFSDNVKAECSLACTDPLLLDMGKLSTKSDIYSFGIITLRLLTGRPDSGIVDEVSKALKTNKLHEILDISAGDWPFIQAQQLAGMALRCCDSDARNRPELIDDAWRVLEPMSYSSLPLSSLKHADDVPSYFICPILQEIMIDPHVASDGFTYDAEAIKGWLESGHDTSPMTNTKLLHQNLIPNRTLRSVIQEWLQQHRRYL